MGKPGAAIQVYNSELKWVQRSRSLPDAMTPDALALHVNFEPRRILAATQVSQAAREPGSQAVALLPNKAPCACRD